MSAKLPSLLSYVARRGRSRGHINAGRGLGDRDHHIVGRSSSPTSNSGSGQGRGLMVGIDKIHLPNLGGGGINAEPGILVCLLFFPHHGSVSMLLLYLTWYSYIYNDIHIAMIIFIQ